MRTIRKITCTDIVDIFTSPIMNMCTIIVSEYILYKKYYKTYNETLLKIHMLLLKIEILNSDFPFCTVSLMHQSSHKIQERVLRLLNCYHYSDSHIQLLSH